MKVYIVAVVSKAGYDAISQEGYSSLEKAQAFIESRFDRPEKVTPFRYRAPERNYLIYEVTIH